MSGRSEAWSRRRGAKSRPWCVAATTTPKPRRTGRRRKRWGDRTEAAVMNRRRDRTKSWQAIIVPPPGGPLTLSPRPASAQSPHLLLLSRFSHPAALRRLGRAGRDAGEPGPTPRAAVSASGAPQRGPGRGGRSPAPRPPQPKAASGHARSSPPATF